MNAKPVSGTVTFLFTDIEGSTHLWEKHPAGMQAALARHDALLRQTIEANEGRVIKTTGDGCHAVFDTAVCALAGALAAQQALAAERWAEISPDSIRVRMALHSGEAQSRAGDYFGQSLNRAARLMSIGHGGQILLSAATAELVRDQTPAGASLRDLGEHQLKDLIHPERVFQLAGLGLPDDFPPLRSLTDLRHNLPLQLTSFIGRGAEMAESRRLLSTTRLLTLTGSGGTGKTRLALQLAADGLDQFPEGAWLVELAPVADPALLAQTVAAALGVREQPGRPLVASLLDFLRAKTLLLVLDNCEHLIDVCAKLAYVLLRGCPHLTILASSREALGVAGETTYRVPSLTLPDTRHTTPEALLACESVRLFTERAQAAQTHFTLTTHNLTAVAQIVLRLDGIPLAIELAAARVKVLSAEQIADRLDDRFRLLIGGSRTALPRQQTLRALIDWSYDLLPAPERAVWRQLSVFAGGWRLEAAEAVIGPDAFDLLSHLADKSLVNVDVQADETRYRLLETVRQYGRDKLFEAGESDALRDRHLAYFATWATQLEPHYYGQDMVPAVRRYQLELDNIRAALDWGQTHNPEAALRLAASNAPSGNRSYSTEWRGRLRAILPAVEALPPAAGEAAQRRAALKAKALFLSGTLAFTQGANREAQALLEASLALATAAGEDWVRLNVLQVMATGALFQGDLVTGQALIEQGEQLSQSDGNAWGQALFGMHRATLARMRGDFETGNAIHEHLRPLVHALGNVWVSALAAVNGAMLATAQQHSSEAAAGYQEAARLFDAMGDQHFVTIAHSELAHLARAQGHYAEALERYAGTVVAWLELGNLGAASHDLDCVAFIAVALGQTVPAAHVFGAAEAFRANTDNHMLPIEQQEYDRAVTALRSQLGTAGLAAEWTVGRSLSLDAALGLVRSLADTI